jgi:hypothetical protein
MMDKFNYLIEGITGDIISYLSDDRHLSIQEAMSIVYNSTLYEKLCDKETGLYIESSGYNYSILSDEVKNGAFIQSEN